MSLKLIILSLYSLCTLLHVNVPGLGLRWCYAHVSNSTSQSNQPRPTWLQIVKNLNIPGRRLSIEECEVAKNRTPHFNVSYLPPKFRDQFNKKQKEIEEKVVAQCETSKEHQRHSKAEKSDDHDSPPTNKNRGKLAKKKREQRDSDNILMTSKNKPTNQRKTLSLEKSQPIRGADVNKKKYSDNPTRMFDDNAKRFRA